jgi:hypothetical protein
MVISLEQHWVVSAQLIILKIQISSELGGAELTQLGKNILSGRNPLSTVFVPTAGQVNQGIAKAISALPGGAIGTNINSQNAQIPSSNQGRSTV